MIKPLQSVGWLASLRNLLGRPRRKPAERFVPSLGIEPLEERALFAFTGDQSLDGTLFTALTIVGGAPPTTAVSGLEDKSITIRLSDSDPLAVDFKLTAIDAGTTVKLNGTTLAVGTVFTEANLSTLGLVVTTTNPDANGSPFGFTIGSYKSGTSTLVSELDANLTFAAVNDAPVLTDQSVPGLTILEDSGAPTGKGAVGVLVSSLVDFTTGGSSLDNVTDIDSGAALGIAVTGIVETHGVWWFSLDGGTNWTEINDAGTPSNASALLLAADADNRLYFEPTLQSSLGLAVPRLTFKAWDTTTGTDGAREDASVGGTTTAFSLLSDTVPVTITPVNDAPVLTDTAVPGLTIAEDAAVPTGAVGVLVNTLVDHVNGSGLDNVTDVDSGPSAGIAITAIDETDGIWWFSLNGGTTWTEINDAGAVSDASALLIAADSDNRLYFRPTQQNPSGTAVPRLTFKAWDTTTGTGGTREDASVGGGSTAFSIATDTVSVTITPVNDAPVLADTTIPSLVAAEDNGTPTGAVGVLVSSFADLVVGGGQNNITDADAGATAGIAITSVVETDGLWWFSLDGGTTWNKATNGTAISNASALLLAGDADNRLYFQATQQNSTGTTVDRLTFKAWDTTSGTDGARGNATTGGTTTAFSLLTDTLPVTITAVNDAPVLTDKSVPGLTIAEDSPAPTGAVGITVDSILDLVVGGGSLDNLTDVDASPTRGIAIVGVDETDGIWWYSLNAGTNWSKVTDGTPISDTSALLVWVQTTDGRLYFQPTVQNPTGTAVDRLTFKAWDRTSGTEGTRADASVGGGTTAFSTASDTLPVTITAVNDRPVPGVTAVAFTNVPQDTVGGNGDTVASLATAAAITDPDVASAPPSLTVTFVDNTNGRWSISINDGSSWTNLGTVGVAGTLGTPIDLDGTLTGGSTRRLRFEPTAGYVGTSNLRFKAWDMTGASSGAPTSLSTAEVTGTVTVTDINDAPVLANTTIPTLVAAEDNGTPTGAVGVLVSSFADLVGGLGQNNITDVDAGASAGIAITNVVETDGIWWFSLDGGTNWTKATNGTAISNASALLLAADADNRLYFEATQQDSTGTPVDRLTFKAWDTSSGTDGARANATTGGTTTAFSTATDTMPVTITAVNDAPVLTDKTLPVFTIAEDTAGAPTGSVGFTMDTILDFVTGGSTLDNIVDVDNGSLRGLAIVGVDETDGIWWFSLNNGTAWSKVTNGTAISDTSALLLNTSMATHRLYFQPTAQNSTGTAVDRLTFKAWDRTTGTAGTREDASVGGGTTAFSLATDTVPVTITPVNDAPVLTDTTIPSLVAAEDNGAPAGAVGMLVSSFADLVGGGGQDNITDVDAGATAGIAITNVVETDGLWWFSLNGGTTWNKATNGTTITNASALLLAADADNRLYFEAAQQNSTGTAVDRLTFKAWDTTSGTDGARGNASTGGTTTVFSLLSDTLPVTITPVNDAPVLTDTTVPTLVAAEDNGTPTGAVGVLVSSFADLVGSGGQNNITDIDAGATAGIAITNVVETDGLWWFSLDGGTTWNKATNGTTITNASALLLAADADNRLYFEATQQNSLGTTFDRLTFKAWDTSSGTDGARGNASTGGTTTAFSLLSDTLPVTITAVNDAPVLTDKSVPGFTIAEDSAAPSGAVGFTVDSMMDYVVGGSTLDNLTDVDDSPNRGIAIVGVDETDGLWWYSLNSGTTWAKVTNGTAVSDSSALLVWTSGTAGRLYFQPTAQGSTGTAVDRLTFKAWDRTGGTEGTRANASVGGGTTAFSLATDTVPVTITPVNDAPVLADTTIPSLVAAEDNGVPTGAVGVLVSSFADLVVGGGQNNITDVDAGASAGIAITNVVETDGLWWFSLDGGTTWNKATNGTTITNASALLLAGDADNRVYFQATQQNSTGTTVDRLTFKAWDTTSGTDGARGNATTGGTTTAFSLLTDTLPVTITAVNDAPVLTDKTVPGLTIAEDSAAPGAGAGVLVSSLVDFVGGGGLDNVTDVDSGPNLGIAIVGVDETDGIWWFSLDGTTWTKVTDGTPISNASALLVAADADNRLYFQPTAQNSTGTAVDRLTFKAWDHTSGTGGTRADASVGGGTTAFSLVTDTVPVTITPVNDAPVLTDTTIPTLVAAEDNGVPTGAVGVLVSSFADLVVGGGQNNITDVDAGATAGIAITNVVETDGIWWFSLDGGTNWNKATNGTTITNASALLLAGDANNRVYFQATQQNSTGTAVDRLTFKAWDTTSGTDGARGNATTGGTTTAFSLLSDTLPVTITPVNDAPVLTDTTIPTLVAAEDNGVPTGAVGVLVSSFADLAGGGGQDNITDIDVGAAAGIAITNVVETDGVWWFSLDGGTTWSKATNGTTITNASALLLAADADNRVYFQATQQNPTGTAVDRLTFKAWDTTSGTDGARGNATTTAFSLVSDTVPVTITPLNDSPVLTVTNITLATINEDGTPSNGGQSINTLLAGKITDPDTASPPNAIRITGLSPSTGTWQVSTNNGTSWFAMTVGQTVLGTHLVRFLPANDNGTTATFTFRADDLTTQGAGDESPLSIVEGTATIVVTDVNDAPVLDNTKSPPNIGNVEDAKAPNPGQTKGSMLVSDLVDYVGGGGQNNVTDVDLPANNLGIAITGLLAPGNGAWYFSLDNGANWTFVDETTVSASSALLLAADADNRLYYKATKNFDGTISNALTFKAWDRTSGTDGATGVNASTGGGTTAFSTASETVNVVISGENDPPVLDNSKSPTLNSIPEDAPLPVGAVGTPVSQLVDLDDGSGLDNVTENDPGDGLGIAVVGADSANGTWYFTLNNGTNWQLLPAVSPTSALLLDAASTARLYFRPNANFDGSATITFKAWDRSGPQANGTPNADTTSASADSPFSAATDTAEVDVTPVNDAPVLDPSKSPVLVTIAEDPGAPVNGSAATLANATSIANLVVLSGGLDNVDDIDSGAVTGVAIVGLDVTLGNQWYYTTDGGATWNLIASLPTVSNSLLLAADGQTYLYFEPNAHENGILGAAVSFFAWDRSAHANGARVNLSPIGAVGGITPFSASSDTAVLTITAVNDAPILADKVQILPTIPEDMPDGANIGQKLSVALQSGSISEVIKENALVQAIVVTGVDQTNGVWQYSLDGGTTWQLFTASATKGPIDLAAAAIRLDDAAFVRFVPDANFNGNATFSFRAWDRTDGGAVGSAVDLTVVGVGGTTPHSAFQDTFSITVTSVNDAPLLDNSAVLNFAGLSEDPIGNNGTTVADLIPNGTITEVAFDKTAVEAILVTQVDNTFGLWQFNTGSGWKNFTASAGGNVALGSFSRFLDANDLIRFVPNPNAFGTATIAFRAWDQESGTSGSPLSFGGDALSVNEGTAAIFVAPVADTPTVTGASFTTDEDVKSQAITVTRNAVDGAEVTHFRVTGISGGEIRLADNTLVNNGDFLTFGTGGTLDLYFLPTPQHSDADGAFSVQAATSATSADLAGGVVPTAITVVAVADTPNLSVPATLTGSENTPLNFPITASLVDTDLSEVLHILVQNVPTNATFNQGSNLGAGTWKFTPAQLTGLTFTRADNGTANLTVRAVAVEGSNGDSATNSANVVVTINNLLALPTIDSGPTTVSEGTPVTYTGSFTDQAGAGDKSFSYQWVVTSDNGQVIPIVSGTVNAPGVVPNLSFTPVNDGTYTIELRVRDKDTPDFSASQSVAVRTLTVTNVAPTVTIVTTPPLNQADEGGTVVYQGSFSDPGRGFDDGYVWTWTAVAKNNGDSFSKTGTVNYVGAGSVAVPDFAFVPSDDDTYTVTLTVQDRPADPDTLTGSAKIGLTVNNVAPTPTISVVPSITDEGELATFGGFFVDPAGAKDGKFDYEWRAIGNGQDIKQYGQSTAPGTVDDFAFIPLDDGTYTITLTVTDKDLGTKTATYLFNVVDVPPSVDISDPNGNPVGFTGLEGSTYVFTGKFTDPGVGEIPYDFVWTVKDGGGKAVGLPQFGAVGGTGAVVNFSFTPPDNDNYTIYLTISDNKGNSSQDTYLFAVDNVTPLLTLDTSDGATSGTEGDAVTFEGAFVDPGEGNDQPYVYTWSVVSSNGQAVPGASGNLTSTGSVPDLTFVPFDNGTYTITLTVRDNDNALGTKSFTYTVINAPPVAQIVNVTGTPIEGTEFEFELTGTDTGANDKLTFTSQLYFLGDDGLQNVLISTVMQTGKTSGDTSILKYVPPDNGKYLLKFTVTDDDGESDLETYAFTVANSDPVETSFTQSPNGTITEGKTFTVVQNFKDAGFDSSQTQTKETFVVTIDWGDGTGPEQWIPGVTPGSAGSPTTGGTNFTHIYADNGSYNATITVVDDDGGTLTRNFTAVIANSDPVVNSPTGNRTVAEGAVLDFTAGSPLLKFTDLGFSENALSETFTVSIDWGDGQTDSNVPVTTFVNGSRGTPTSGYVAAKHIYADNKSDNSPYQVTVTFRDDDGGTFTHKFDVNVTNVAPSVVNGTATAVVNEGSSLALVDFLTFSDPGFTRAPNAENFTYSIDWGDGTAVVPVSVNAADVTNGSEGVSTVGKISGSHTYADNGVYAIQVRVFDDDGGSFAAPFVTIVTVENVAPAVTSGPGDTSVDEGALLGLPDLIFSDPGFSNSAQGTFEKFTYEIDWNDGTALQTGSVTTVTNGNAANPTVGTLSLTHRFADNRATPYGVTVRITDDDGGEVVHTFEVTVDNVAPTLTLSQPQVLQVEEGEYMFLDDLIRIADPGYDQNNSQGVAVSTETFTVTISYVNRSNSTEFIEQNTQVWEVVAGGPGTNTTGTFDLFHIFPDNLPGNGMYELSIVVTDDDGGVSNTLTFEVEVVNVAPFLFDFGPLYFLEGQEAYIEFIFYDPGFETESFSPVHPTTAFITYAPGLGSLLQSNPTLSPSPSPDYPVYIWSITDIQKFIRAGNFTLFVTVQDHDGGVSTMTVEVIVIDDPNFVIDTPEVEVDDLSLPPVSPVAAPPQAESRMDGTSLLGETRGSQRSSQTTKPQEINGLLRLQLRVDKLRSFRGAVEKIEINDVLTAGELTRYRDRFSKLKSGVYRITVSSEGVEAQSQELELTQENSSKAWRLLDSLMRRLESQFDPEQELQNLVPIPGTTHFEAPQRGRPAAEQPADAGPSVVALPENGNPPPTGDSAAPPAEREAQRPQSDEVRRKVSLRSPGAPTFWTDERIWSGASCAALVWLGVPRNGSATAAGNRKRLGSEPSEAEFELLFNHWGEGE